METEPHWMTEPPTQPGWYWYWSGPWRWMVEVVGPTESWHESLMARIENPADYQMERVKLSELTGQWAGPLEPPT